LKQSQSPVEVSDAGNIYAQDCLLSANVIDLTVVVAPRVKAFERSVGLGNLLEFSFSILVLGDIGVKALGERAKS
jgi:hypothetical protein